MYRVLLFLVVSIIPAQAGLSELEAISMIESGNNDGAVGDAGEVSRFQIMPRVWKTYTASRAYQNKEVSRIIAQKHLDYLETLFQGKTGRSPTDFDLYVLWNAGPTYYSRVGFAPGRVHRIIRERANRFVNLRQMPDPEPAQGILALGVLR